MLIKKHNYTTIIQVAKNYVIIFYVDTLADLMTMIYQLMTQIDRMVEKVEVHFLGCIQQCVNENGHNFQDVIFET